MEDDEEAAHFKDEFVEKDEYTADEDESEARITRLERIPIPQQNKSVWEKDPLRYRLLYAPSLQHHAGTAKILMKSVHAC
jgi:hypothetical protein